LIKLGTEILNTRDIFTYQAPSRLLKSLSKDAAIESGTSAYIFVPR
jgi:hypothetical protein